MPPRSRRAALFFAGTVALALAGCADTGSSVSHSESVKSLSDLSEKGGSLLKLGDASRQAGDCQAAVRFYRLVKDQDDNHHDAAAARLGAADCELSMNALPDAERDYKLARSLQPQDPAPLIGLGRLYLVAHKPGEAASYLDQAIAKGANAAFVWNDKGVAYDQLRRHKEAQLAYRAGLVKFPDDRALRNNLALSLAMTGGFAEAESLLRRLVAEPGESARTRENLALVLGLEGKMADAREVAKNDLDGAALDNNSRFYQYARATITGQPVADTSPVEDRTVSERAAIEPAAPAPRVAAAPIPPPVLTKEQPLTILRSAEPVIAHDDRPAATPAPAKARPESAPAATQTAELPPPAVAPKSKVGEPTQIAAPDGGPLKPTPAAVTTQPVATSE